MVHNYYRQAGGEDVAFAAEKDLLRLHGHEVIEYTDTNMRLDSMGRFGSAMNMIWSGTSYRSIRKTIESARPDIAHFHNTFMMISPSAYYACHDEGVPVVQTLHNFRLLCPAAVFYRDGKVCEECMGSFFTLSGVTHACYHRSRMQTVGVSAMLAAHKIIGTWEKQIDFYVALTEFSRQKFIEGGLPASKIVVKPNFVTPVSDKIGKSGGGFALFVGRLSGEKGVLTMLNAWKILPSPVPLKIIGNGPLQPQVLKFIEENPLAGAEYLGIVNRNQVASLMQEARFLVFPSEWYEGFPMVIAESFACGLPVVSSGLGSMMEIVQDQVTGVFFSGGNANDLAEKVDWLWNHPQQSEDMGRAARLKYEQKFTPGRNYQLLLGIYQRAMSFQ
jgi:glycosyltransferase involved in cell wall biosynthesis